MTRIIFESNNYAYFTSQFCKRRRCRLDLILIKFARFYKCFAIYKQCSPSSGTHSLNITPSVCNQRQPAPYNHRKSQLIVCCHCYGRTCLAVRSHVTSDTATSVRFISVSTTCSIHTRTAYAFADIWKQMS